MKKLAAFIGWILSLFLLSGVVVYGFSIASACLLIAALLVCPLFRDNVKLPGKVWIPATVALFILGGGVLPSRERSQEGDTRSTVVEPRPATTESAEARIDTPVLISFPSHEPTPTVIPTPDPTPTPTPTPKPTPSPTPEPTPEPTPKPETKPPVQNSASKSNSGGSGNGSSSKSSGSGSSSKGNGSGSSSKSSGGGGSGSSSGGSGNGNSSKGGGNANNFNTYDNEDQQETSATYVLNTSTKKFHDPSCRDVPKIKRENYDTSSRSRSSLISMGYDPCRHCDP